MKAIAALILIMFASQSALCQNAQSNKDKKKLDRMEAVVYEPAPLYHLTEKDRRNYLLTISAKTIKHVRRNDSYDNFHKIKTNSYASIELKFTNRCSDTLKYVNMSCAWDCIYKTNNNLVKIQDWPCESNFPEWLQFSLFPIRSLSFPLNLTSVYKTIGLR